MVVPHHAYCMRLLVFILSSQLFIGVSAWADKPILSSSPANNTGVNGGVTVPSGASVTSGAGNDLYYIGGAIAAAGLVAVLFSSQGKGKGATPAIAAVNPNGPATINDQVDNVPSWAPKPEITNGIREPAINTVNDNSFQAAVGTRGPLTMNDQADYVRSKAPNSASDRRFNEENIVLAQAAGGQAQGRVRGGQAQGRVMGRPFYPTTPSFGPPATGNRAGRFDYIPPNFPPRGQRSRVPVLPEANGNGQLTPQADANGGIPHIGALVQRCREQFEEARRRSSTERGGTPGLEGAGSNPTYNGFRWNGTIQPDGEITSNGRPTIMFEGKPSRDFDECMRQGVRRPF